MALPSIDPEHYARQLARKVAAYKQAFARLDLPEPEVCASQPQHYRLRAEFRIWHQGERLDYAMFDPCDPKQVVTIEQFAAVALPIHHQMPRLREYLQGSAVLRRRLFQVEFLATLSGECLVSLIYHRPLDDDWLAAARQLGEALNVLVIGRSRGQKCVLKRDWVMESFELDGRPLRYQQFEGSFSQPNGGVNRMMLRWACAQAGTGCGDLLELYCGNGNFTVALAPHFNKVLATEVSKSSVKAAHYNLACNQIDNVTMVRLSSQEISEAIARVRPFRRLNDVDLDSYRFSTLFVDPPRSGLDASSLELARGFERILYISCNPVSLLENVTALQATHRIVAAAAFDQFPYTDHLECGLVLERR